MLSVLVLGEGPAARITKAKVRPRRYRLLSGRRFEQMRSQKRDMTSTVRNPLKQFAKMCGSSLGSMDCCTEEANHVRMASTSTPRPCSKHLRVSPTWLLLNSRPKRSHEDGLETRKVPHRAPEQHKTLIQIIAWI